MPSHHVLVMSDFRIVFMGTGDIAIDAFSALLHKGLVALVTQPDKPVGRKQILTAPKIKEVAVKSGIPVLQPVSAKEEVFLKQLDELKADIIVVMAYGQILSQKLLDMPQVACINLHASLLPKYRGAACIQAAIDAGDTHSGITVMHVVKALDAGDMILKKEVEIRADETGGSLHDRLADLGPEAVLEAVSILADENHVRTPQDEKQVSHISKLMRNDGEIDWSMDAVAIERRIRAYDPWPGTSTSYQDKKGRSRRLKIFPQLVVSDGEGKPGEVISVENGLLVACGKGALLVTDLQPDGSRKMLAKDFLVSGVLEVGNILGVTEVV